MSTVTESETTNVNANRQRRPQPQSPRKDILSGYLLFLFWVLSFKVPWRHRNPLLFLKEIENIRGFFHAGRAFMHPI